MAPPLLRRRPRRRAAVVAAVTASTVVAALGAWAVVAGPAHADDVQPDVVTSLNVETLYDYGAVGRVRLPAANAIHVEGLLVDPSELQLRLEDGLFCPPGCDYTALVTAQLTLELGLLKAKTQQFLEGEGVALDKIDLGLPDDPIFANYVAEDGSPVMESNNPRSVDTAPNAYTDYHASMRADGTANLNYYARAQVSGGTSISGNFEAWASGSAGTLMFDSFMGVGENDAGIAVTGAMHLVGGDKLSVQGGRASVQFGLEKEKGGDQVGFSGSVDAYGNTKFSFGVTFKVYGKLFWVRFDTIGGFDVHVPGFDGGYHDGSARGLVNVVDFYDWFKKGVGWP